MANCHHRPCRRCPSLWSEDHDLKKLLKACEGKTFDTRQDTALLWVFVDRGVRLGEVTSLDVDDIDFDLGVIHVGGKGARARAVPFSAKVGWALGSYRRARTRHPKAASPGLTRPTPCICLAGGPGRC
ncbi:MAG: tyrosine-type recombinase/integrase [Acidimicrobiales bacterium]